MHPIRHIRLQNDNLKEAEFQITPMHQIIRIHPVMNNEAIRYGAHHWLFVSNAAVIKKVGMPEVGNGIYNIFYRNVLLGYFDIRKFEIREQYLHLSKAIV